MSKGPFSEYFDAKEAAARSNAAVPVPPAMTDPNATAEAKAAAEEVYMERLLAKASTNYTTEEKAFIYRQLSDYTRGDK